MYPHLFILHYCAVGALDFGRSLCGSCSVDIFSYLISSIESSIDLPFRSLNANGVECFYLDTPLVIINQLLSARGQDQRTY